MQRKYFIYGDCLLVDDLSYIYLLFVFSVLLSKSGSFFLTVMRSLGLNSTWHKLQEHLSVVSSGLLVLPSQSSFSSALRARFNLKRFRVTAAMTSIER